MNNKKTKNDNDNKTKTKGYANRKGSGRKLDHLAGLSKEEVSLFEEHAREDNEPSTSRGVYHEPALDVVRPSGLVTTSTKTLQEKREDPRRETTAAGCQPSSSQQRAPSPLLQIAGSDTGRASNRSEASQQRDRRPSPAGRGQKPYRHSESGESSDSSRGTGRRRRGKRPTLPPPGHPGGLDDPRRIGLSGAGVKWYLRYLEEGKTPEAARQLVEQRPKHPPDQPCAAQSSKRDQHRYRAEKKRKTVPAPATEQKRGEQTVEPAPAAKRRSGQITPQAPTAKRQRANPPPPALWPRERQGVPPPAAPRDNGGQQSSYADALKGIRLAVLPKNYPAEALGQEDLTALQEAIMDEVLKGWTHPLAFCGVYFRPGLLLVDCKDEKTAEWMAEVAPRLAGWKGPQLDTKRGDEIPPTHNVTVYLPRSADKSASYAIGLLKAQNGGLKPEAWRVLSSNTEDTGLRLNLGIDEDSYETVRRMGFRLNYRFSSVTMRPWRQKAAGDTEAPLEAMVTDEGSDSLPRAAEEPNTAEAPPSGEPRQVTGNMEARQVTGPDHPRQVTGTADIPTTQELLEGLDLRKLELDRRSESELRLSDEEEPETSK